MSRRVVVAGNLSLDDTIGPGGAFLAAPGGDALYASLGALAWGAAPVLLTLAGEDYPDAHLARIVAVGIDASHVRRTTGPAVHYRVTNGVDGSRRYEWISPPDRLLATSPEAADYAALEGAAWLHVAAMPIEAQEVAIAEARRAGVPASLDPHEEQVVGYEARLAAMGEGVAFMPSELEVRLLFPDLAEAGDVADAGEAADAPGLGAVRMAFAAAERLDAWHPALVVVKLGERGSVVRSAGRSVHVPAPPVPVVDSTGAGDAYCGGFVAAWLATGSPVVAAACGTVAAAETIAGFGAFRDSAPPAAADRLARVREVLDLVDPAAVEPAAVALALDVLGRGLPRGIPSTEVVS